MLNYKYIILPLISLTACVVPSEGDSQPDRPLPDMLKSLPYISDSQDEMAKVNKGKASYNSEVSFKQGEDIHSATPLSNDQPICSPCQDFLQGIATIHQICDYQLAYDLTQCAKIYCENVCGSWANTYDVQYLDVYCTDCLNTQCNEYGECEVASNE